MAEIINLRRARKARAKTEKEAQAAENRLRFGMSASARRAMASERDKNERHLDAHQREELSRDHPSAPELTSSQADDGQAE